MTIYLILFLVSVGGSLLILARHRQEIRVIRFASVMEALCSECNDLWYTYAHGAMLRLVEKVLHKVRIVLLKFEYFLYKKVTALRKYLEENGHINGSE